jgi:uncharacterized protein (TIGR00725 family)
MIMVNDPVCGMNLEPWQAEAMLDYQGRLYYFCSTACRKRFQEQPEIYLNKAPAMRLTVGVMGSASNDEPQTVKDLAFALGQAIAAHGYVLITGACPGLPYECARGAVDKGGMSVGISPGLSLNEHVHKYQSPSDAFDVLIYTGSGLMGREVTNIRSSDMVIIVGGRSGTLGEFAIAYDEGKLIGVLEGSGGITALLPDLEETLQKGTGARVIYQTNPQRLIEELAEAYRKGHYRRPSCFCNEILPATG